MADETESLGHQKLRKFLRGQGITDAAIDELFKGNPIMSYGVREISPGFAIPGREFVNKDGEVQEIVPPDQPTGVIHRGPKPKTE